MRRRGHLPVRDVTLRPIHGKVAMGCDPTAIPGPLLLSLKYDGNIVYAKYNAMKESIPECGALPGWSAECYLDAERYLDGYESGLGFGTYGMCLHLLYR